MWQHVVESFALKLNVNVVEMIDPLTDDLQALSLVDAMELWKPVEQLRLEPSQTQKHTAHCQ